MAFGFGFGFAKNYVVATLSAFNPTSLFAAGEQGVYFDPNNTATLFEDAAGTIPTALERPVGLMLDLSGRGNHATSSSTARPTLTRRVNLLSNTEAFNNGVWKDYLGATKSGTSVCALSFGSGTDSAIYQTIPANPVSTRYICSATVKSSAGKKFRFALFIGGSTVLYSPDITTTANFATYSYTFPAAVLATGATINIMNESSGGTGQIEVNQPDLRPANIGVGLPAYQRVGDTSVNAADYDTTGFPAWLRCSGGQSMVTPSINFTGTAQMFVCTGIRKIGSGSSIAVEFGPNATTTNSTFALYAPGEGTNYYLFWTRGTSSAYGIDSRPSVVSPITNVISGQSSIAGTSSFARIKTNGMQIGEDLTNQGVVTYGNYPLYLFARNQSSLFFNGLAGPTIVRGAQSSAAEIANAENWIDAQQKVY